MPEHRVTSEFIDFRTGARVRPAADGEPAAYFEAPAEVIERYVGKGCLSPEPRETPAPAKVEAETATAPKPEKATAKKPRKRKKKG